MLLACCHPVAWFVSGFWLLGFASVVAIRFALAFFLTVKMQSICDLLSYGRSRCETLGMSSICVKLSDFVYIAKETENSLEIIASKEVANIIAQNDNCKLVEYYSTKYINHGAKFPTKFPEHLRNGMSYGLLIGSDIATEVFSLLIRSSSIQPNTIQNFRYSTLDDKHFFIDNERQLLFDSLELSMVAERFTAMEIAVYACMSDLGISNIPLFKQILMKLEKWELDLLIAHPNRTNEWMNLLKFAEEFATDIVFQCIKLVVK